ncbi:hypothetical protein QBC41DRAFT_340176 [Cercophora samala]|uniref:Uncharacterized protein n=1 Tax=Cercophora samala TaxID=330535 RepID=A0AA39Z6G6_9PEZI|nr:hypothetical protein QBC41DRAFT_340176 [Cercophora samala]
MLLIALLATALAAVPASAWGLPRPTETVTKTVTLLPTATTTVTVLCDSPSSPVSFSTELFTVTTVHPVETIYSTEIVTVTSFPPVATSFSTEWFTITTVLPIETSFVTETFVITSYPAVTSIPLPTESVAVTSLGPQDR